MGAEVVATTLGFASLPAFAFGTCGLLTSGMMTSGFGDALGMLTTGALIGVDTFAVGLF